MSQEQVLVVDDEEVMRDVLGRVLSQAGYEVSFAETGPEAVEMARKGPFAAAIVDVMLPEMGGLEVLEELKRHDPELVVLMITAFASMEMAIDAIKRGAFYFVPKPFDNQQLLHVLASGLLQRQLTDENRIQQVFFNLILNARDAMPSGGWLTLRTHADDETVVVEVGDTGHGIRREHIRRIYDPFFTTKGIGKGTGLGLSVSYGIVQEHGGAIFVESDPGHGTTFQVALPALVLSEAARQG